MEVAAVRGVLASVLGMLDERGDAHRRGDRPRHRVVPQRLWPGYKTSAGVDPELLAQFPLLEDALARARRRRLADGRVRGRRRAGGGGRAGGARTRASSASSSARPTRTSRSACAARASCSWIAATRERARRGRRDRRSSACRPRRFPTTSRSSATRRTGIRGCRAGARSPRRPCSRGSATSKRSLPTGASGTSTRRAPRALADTLDARARSRAALPHARDARVPTSPLFERVDELEWTGPTPAFEALAARLEFSANRLQREPRG